MKKINYLCLTILCSYAYLSAGDNLITTLKKESLETHQEKLSYCLGQIIGEKIKSGDIDLNVDVFISSLRDHISDKKSRLNKKEMNEVMTVHNKDVKKKKLKNIKVQAEKGVELMKKNGKDPRFTTTKNGVQYRIIKKGDGEKPKVIDIAKVHYTGKVISGRIFDTSVGRGDPVEMQLNKVIPGLTQALQLMPVGSKWEITIPSHLAYGKNPDPRSGILPNEILIFDVELFDIVKPKVKK